MLCEIVHSCPVEQTGDSFVIVACDGLWDELSNHEAVTRCANFLQLAEEGERGGVAQVRRFKFPTFATLHDFTTFQVVLYLFDREFYCPTYETIRSSRCERSI